MRRSPPYSLPKYSLALIYKSCVSLPLSRNSALVYHGQPTADRKNQRAGYNCKNFLNEN
jgi:hypothetical protein